MTDRETNGVTPEPDSTEDSTGFAGDFAQDTGPHVFHDGDEGQVPLEGTAERRLTNTHRSPWDSGRSSFPMSTVEGVVGSPSSSSPAAARSLNQSSNSSNASSSVAISQCSSQRGRSQPVAGTPRLQALGARRSSEGSNPVSGEHGESTGPDRPQVDVDEEDRSRMATGFKGPSADWTLDACSLSHVFVPTLSSGDSCYLNSDCKHSGARMKCVACRIIAHEGCISTLNSRFVCRQTFRESVRKYREQTTIQHHWVERKNLKGKCKSCAKTFQSKLGFGSGSIVGLNCSWCKYNYHNKDGCLKALENDKTCDLGNHSKVVVPPSWIVKLPRKGSFKSSLKSSPNKNKRTNKTPVDSTIQEGAVSLPNGAAGAADGGGNNKNTPFCIKPIPSPDVAPILVFLNPKSGGNQGAKLMQKFQWLLNPRQVFDLTQGGPGPAIEMFRRVPNIRLLACGGDGTVGWVLSVLDKMPVDPPPAVGVLPLGTGNDLSRSLGWGGGYIDEPISKIISALSSSATRKMDRWTLNVTRNPDLPPTEDRGEDKLPLNVVNNYFSFGVDAQIALQFHEAREANPQKFNSRIRNKMYYGQAGGKDLLLRKWKDLSDMITVECDGVDITPKLKEHRVHSVLFANIPSFGSGTRPWNRAVGEQRIDDGLIEVMGLTTYQLPLLQAGGHASCITQCKKAVIVTKKTIPMQVDGEASRLNPATIELSFLNQVVMMAKTKGAKSKGGADQGDAATNAELKLKVSCMKMGDYATHHTNKEKLKELAGAYGEISTTAGADLEQVRGLINKLQENNPPPSPDMLIKDNNWCFVDTVTAIRFFRVDRAQENLHYVLDVCDDAGLYILDEEEDEMEDEIFEPKVRTVDEKSPSNTPGKSPTGTPRKTPTPQKSPSTKSPTVAQGAGLEAPSSANPRPIPALNQVLEKTTEGILKAARLGDLKMLSELNREGYSLLSIDETGKTALHYGARFGHKEIVKFLIATANPSILDMVDNEKGQTALHKAAAYKRRTICCMLIAAGASLLISDTAGLSPRQLALMAEDTELAAYLESQEHFQAERKAVGDPEASGDFETPV